MAIIGYIRAGTSDPETASSDQKQLLATAGAYRPACANVDQADTPGQP